jgi:hypothetical protein
MTAGEPWLSSAGLAALAMAAERGLLTAPISSMQLARYVGRGEQEGARQLLDRLFSAGLRGGQLAAALSVAAEARRAGEGAPRPTLVWSDLDEGGTRDTGVVCNELFREARSSVVLSTYSLGHRARPGEAPGNPTLRPLAERMLTQPQLRVRLFANLQRPNYLASGTDREIELAFARWFRDQLWPWERLPEVYYDPRSLTGQGDETACLHAKCVVVDDERALVTSANLTEAAQHRNIEAGVLVDDPLFAYALRIQFESLIERGHVRRVTGLG